MLERICDQRMVHTIPYALARSIQQTASDLFFCIEDGGQLQMMLSTPPAVAGMNAFCMDLSKNLLLSI